MPVRFSRPVRHAAGLFAAGAVVTSMLVASPATAASTAPAAKAPLSQLTAGRYIVTLKAPAASGYQGGNPKYAATYSRRGTFDARSAAVAAYTDHLRTTQSKVADSVGADLAAHLTMATNGFVADLSAKQVQELSIDSRVLMVSRSESLHVTSTNTADFLGMNGKSGAWAKHGGQKNAGAGIVIGDLDTGIWPESKSFAGSKLTSKPQTAWDISQTGTATTMEKADGSYFHGACEAGDGWAATDCTTKIISARYYGDGFTATVPPAEWSPYEQDSARDGGGHGSHTASTAAGEQVDNVTVEGRKFGTVVGMAPAAKLAVYKVCWEAADPDKSSCTTPDIVEAIDQAVADGVDVINYSIGGSASADLDAIQAAFEGAAEAGVFISASAGNSGPAASTLDNATPWVTTVAASTYVNLENTLVLGNGKKIVGASISDKTLTDKPLVNSTDVMAAGADVKATQLCGPDTLGDATGDIVVCARGTYDRVAKSAEVKRAGGIGMVLINPTENSLDADFHSVPTIHISDTDGPKVYNYLESAGKKATASFKLGNITGTTTPLPQVAGFSSRGPTPLADGDLLKPDISAPGVSVLAAVAPPSNSDRTYDLYSGTSMAAPHITGLAAFIQGKHPTWTPAEIKSALMTTATPTKTAAGKASTDALAQGSGEVNPKKMFDPGLFVTSDATQWQGFIQSLGYDLGVDPVDAKQVNVPSMADGSVTGETTFTRTFRASRAGTWTIKGGVPGFTMHTSVKKVVSKRVNDLQQVTFTFTRDDAALGDYAQGAVTLSGPTQVRLPVALRALSVDAPAQVDGTGTSGSEDVAITAGFTGNLDIGTHGLAESDTKSDAVAAGESNYECVTVGADSSLARIQADAVDDDADIDLYVYASETCDHGDASDANLVGISATASGDEAVTLPDPDPGTYLVKIDGFAPGASGSPIPYDFDFWDITPTTTAGDLTVTPNPVPVTQNEETTVSVSWSGLDADSHYLGFLSYPNTDAITVVDVKTGS